MACVSKLDRQLKDLGAVYMRAETGQKTGRDDCRDSASTILSSRSVFCVYMEPGRFSSRPG